MYGNEIPTTCSVFHFIEDLRNRTMRKWQMRNFYKIGTPNFINKFNNFNEIRSCHIGQVRIAMQLASRIHKVVLSINCKSLS